MVRAAFLREHRTWEDWAGICLGILIGMTPWFAGATDDQSVVLNSVAVGLLVLAIAAFEFVDLRRGQEVAELACGLWLLASPFVFGYGGAGSLRIWHVALGTVVALLAAMELWQDWKLSPDELAKHGR